MKRFLPVFLVALALGFSADSDARRFGGGKSFGKQRPAPTLREAPRQQATTPPAQQGAQPGAANAAPAAAGAAGTAARTGFMGRWGGVLAGLGIGALLATMFGAQLGPIIGLLLAVLLFAGLAMLLLRLFAGRGAAAATAARGDERRVQFAGIGSAVPGGGASGGHPVMARDADPAPIPADFDAAAFERVAKTSFLRLQAANDARDLDDIRDFTTPEMFAELAMQASERGAAEQRTEVVSLDARLIEVAREDGYEIASVRFWGLVREDGAPGPSPFDETWHVQKKLGERRASWLIAGIQQND